MAERDYDSTVARMAGNIAAGLVDLYTGPVHVHNCKEKIVDDAVEIAARIIERCRARHAAQLRTGSPD